MAADYANLGSGYEGAGTALNLYSITSKGVDLVQTYVLQQKDYTGQLASPLTLSMNPAHDFVYVVYSGPKVEPGGNSYQPILVAFKITPKGLELQWQNIVVTGDPGLRESSITAGKNYIMENTFPCCGLVVVIYSQSGQLMVEDPGENGEDLVSAHISPNGDFYYSCVEEPTATYPAPTADTVRVYELSDTSVLYAALVQPLATSTDPTIRR